MRRIAAGTLPPSTRLPGTRRLARQLGINRNTVAAAYGELESQGWIVARSRSGFFINTLRPTTPPQARPTDPARARALDWPELPLARPIEEAPPDLLNASGGLVDVRRIPATAIAQSLRRAMNANGKRLLDYNDPQGALVLRQRLAEMVGLRRGISATPEQLLVTRGSQMALYLVANALLRPGDLVAVEGYGYPPAWNALSCAGATLVPLAIDHAGAQVDALESLARSGRLKLVYLTPQHQYPTTVTLHPQRRRRLLALAEQYGFMVLEDDYDNEFHYDGRPILPLAAQAELNTVIYVSTFSKILAPGLRIGFVIANDQIMRRLVALRRVIDRQGDWPLEHALAELIELGELPRHVRRIRRLNHHRRDHLVGELQRLLPDQLQFRVPGGGISLWLEARPAIDLEALAGALLQRQILLRAGRYFAFDGAATPHFRLGFAHLDDAQLTHVVSALASAWPER